jgi:putative aldouronate transport system permease protein
MSLIKPQTALGFRRKDTFLASTARDFRMNKWVYLMAVPVVAYYVVFCYGPMYGAIIAFKDFRGGLGIWGSPWVGLKHFISFFRTDSCWDLIRNTVLLSVYNLLFGFPAPIVFALLINEVRRERFKRVVQTVSYIPHFVSIVVVCGMVTEMTSSEGLINDVAALFGGTRENLLIKKELFRTIYVSSGIWTNIGWGSIIYLAALSNVDVQLYEAAIIDGANRFRQLWHITLPSITPTIIILLILDIGSLLSIGWEKVLLLYNPLTYDTADIIATFVYRRGLEMSDFSFASAIGLMNSVVNLLLLYAANRISRMASRTSLW